MPKVIYTHPDGLHHQLDTTDHQVDALVYDLYSLTDGEIELVEDSFYTVTAP